ncbi:hypothetical protein O3G_MSEX010203 [Manduca sexta]|uniref:Uncharacterized protein n=1 Tax=Manduca sexta TaxID=7130 RepID=A0A921ZGL9_MANSE|nr:hypothetical protein O3G_MSEX010203 [Manduca sexta]KAG6457268.1 hypothetical protein O3G_MSEX010203 [Manduca sexta]
MSRGRVHRHLGVNCYSGNSLVFCKFNAQRQGRVIKYPLNTKKNVISAGLPGNGYLTRPLLVWEDFYVLESLQNAKNYLTFIRLPTYNFNDFIPGGKLQFRVCIHYLMRIFLFSGLHKEYSDKATI